MSEQFIRKSEAIFSRIADNPEDKQWQLKFNTVGQGNLQSQQEKAEILEDLQDLESPVQYQDDNNQDFENESKRQEYIRDIDRKIQEEFGQDMNQDEVQRLQSALDKEEEYDDLDSLATDSYHQNPEQAQHKTKKEIIADALTEKQNSLDNNKNNQQQQQEQALQQRQRKQIQDILSSGDLLEVGKDVTLTKIEEVDTADDNSQSDAHTKIVRKPLNDSVSKENSSQQYHKKNNRNQNHRKSQVPDYLVNPQKYTRYELDEPIAVGKGVNQLQNDKNEIPLENNDVNKEDMQLDTQNDQPMDDTIQLNSKNIQKLVSTSNQEPPSQKNIQQFKSLQEQYEDEFLDEQQKQSRQLHKDQSQLLKESQQLQPKKNRNYRKIT